MKKLYMKYLAKIELLKNTLKEKQKDNMFRVEISIAIVSVFLTFLIIASLYCCFGDKHTK